MWWAQVADLKRHLEARGLSSAGLKAELAARLKGSLPAVQQAGSPSSGAAAGGVAPEDVATARKVPLLMGFECMRLGRAVLTGGGCT